MDFSQPYRVITPTLEGPVLRALAGAQAALTRGQIVALVQDASEAGVRKALGRLVEQGIVIEQRIGKRYAYLANREHLLWPSIESLFSARRLLEEGVRAAVAEWEFPPTSVEFFGSQVRGGSDADSDVDVLIVRPNLDPGSVDIWEEQVAQLHDGIVRWTGNPCDIVVLSARELEQAREHDEPILRPPTTNVAGTPLAALLDHPGGVTSQAAATLAEQAAARSRLEALSDQLSALAVSHQEFRDSFAGLVSATTSMPAVAAALEDQRELLRPLLETDTSAVRAAARALRAHRSVGSGDDAGQ